MDHFWPTLPIVIPKSEGVPIWWDIAWWVFQIVVMVFLLVLIARWAVNMDREVNADSDKKAVVENHEQPPIQG